jgi:multidrug efflux pump subunit AcrA (membrane-fusion protein)
MLSIAGVICLLSSLEPAADRPAAPVVVPGHLLPAEVRSYYPPFPGSVKRVHVADGQKVKKGELLLEVESRELNVRAAILQKEIAATEQLVEELRKELPGVVGREEKARLEIMLVEAREKVKQKSAELREVQRAIDSGNVRASADGVVIGADRARLVGKGVGETEMLLQVARVDGPWHAVVRLRQEEFGRVLAALNEQKKLVVELRVKSLPKQRLTATLERGDLASEATEEGKESFVLARVRFDEATSKKVRDLPVRSTVEARIRVQE